MGEPRLLPGAAHFAVTELPAYAPSGSGEHLYLLIEKEGLTTDQVAEALAGACGRSFRDVGYAGRKDRHAVTVQWFSVLGAKEVDAAALAERLRNGRIVVRESTRHGNKLRLGHLYGNRFRLGLADADSGLGERLAALTRLGVLNRFGPQRFGAHGATLRLAKAWGAHDLEGACAAIVDPSGAWRWGDPLPEGFRQGPEGRVLGALRRGAAPGPALRATGDQLLKLVASAAQSAVFNAILDARVERGLVHAVRPGDLAATVKGAPFTVGDDEAVAVSERCQRFDAFATAPLPGSRRLAPAPAVDAEERAWAAGTGIDWAWFGDRAVFESPGERRNLVMPFLEPPVLTANGAVTWLELALPSGGYATEVLTQVGVALPEDRRG